MEEQSFGRFIRQCRHEMDLTQDELARRVGCAAITIRKIEAEDARPSVQIAERLALSLAIPLDNRDEFVRRARAIRPETDHPLSSASLRLEEIGSEDLTGRAIRGYALTEKIGSGSMGAVYRAVQPTVGREVAIKIILPKYANHPDFIRRFETEAQLVARLEHPHIVPLYDYWREPGVAYLVMRLLRGGNLQSLIEIEPLSVNRVLLLLEQIGSALTYAHRIGVIHRDLKPANILLDEDQNAYLADFGIAKHLGSPELTDQAHPGAAIAPPQYSSPEQLHSHTFRPQSDIYCLGVMLYEMLTGRIPFVGPTPLDFVEQHISAPLPPLSAHHTGLPAALDAVIARATDKNPEERYADVASMLLDFRRVVSGIVTQPVFVEEKVVPHEMLNPYKGLRPFSEADADDFFGRETLIQQLLARLSEGGDLARFLAVIGPSGSGKSSVVKAGLLPALRRGGLLNSENWFYVDLEPGGNPFEELESALLRVAVSPSSRLLSLRKDGNRGLLRTVNCILPDDPSVELVLVIDQFEELFTLLEDEDERALFLGNLVTAILDESSRLRVIVTLRADFIDRPLRYVDFGELIQRRNEFVLPLTPDELEQVIVGPARRHGLRIESGLVFSILSDLGDQPGTLPMLQYALTELFDQREGNVLTKHGYQRIGGVLGALSRRADEVYLGMNESDQALAQQLFLRLITLGEGVEDTRRRVLLMELEQLRTAGEPSGLSHPVHGVMELFSRSRLLIFDIDPITRGPTVEISHESLLREWPQLRTWVDESRTDVHLQRQLASAAREWQNAGRDQSFLLTGTHLEQFDAWSQTTKLAFTQHEREFLGASLELAEREKAERAKVQAREATLKLRVQRVLQVLAGVFLIAAVISGTLAYWANGQREEALRQASIGLASQAQLELQGTSPETSVLLAVEALEEYPYTWQAEQKLVEILHDFRLRHILSGHTATVSDVAWSPDGDRIATASRDGTVRIWDSTSWTTVSIIQAHAAFDSDFSSGEFATGESGVRAVLWSPDGKMILTLGNTDQVAGVWDGTTGNRTASFASHQDKLLDAGWSPDGKAIISSAGDGSVFIWDSTTGKVQLAFPTQPTPIQSVSWSPNGSLVATAGEDGFIKLWDARTGDELDILTGHEGIVWSISWSPDGTKLASAGEDGTIWIWDIAKGEQISSIQYPSAFWQVTWSPDGSQLATTNADGLAQVWSISSLGEGFELSGRSAGRFTIAWSPDGEWLATTSRTDSVVRIWTTSLEPVELPAVHTEQAGWVMWSPDGNQLATGSDDFLSIIWDGTTGDVVRPLKGHTNWVQQAVWSPDGSHIATASFDNTVRIWNARSGEEEFTFTGHSADPINRLFDAKGILNVIWSPDGTRVASQGLTGWVRVWDSNTHKEILVFQTNEDLSEPMSWSPDGSRIATCAVPQILQVWNASTGKPLIGGFVNNTSNLTFQDFIPYCISTSWSPDGGRILTAGWDGSASIWDANTGERLLTFTGHGQPINAAAWSPNGERVATGDNSGVVKIWIADTGLEVFSFKTSHPFIFSLSWSPDGSRLAGTGGLVSPSVWRVWQSTEELIDYAHECCMIGELTSEKRQQLGLPLAITE